MRKQSASGWRRAVGGLVIGALAFGLLTGVQSTAFAVGVDQDLPTWDDVQAAKNNQAKTDAAISKIENLIKEGEKELDRLRNLHAATIEDLKAAEEALAKASDKAATLERQAKESRKEADEAADRAGVIVAQMYRSGGVDRSMELFLDSDKDTADALLERMASMSKATERNTQISEEAKESANTAASLGEQAEAAKQEREALRADKAEKEAAAAVAVTDQGELVRKQESQQRDLAVKLEALKDKTAKTVDGYEERLRQEEAERERIRKEQEEAARRERERQEREGNTNQPPPPPTSPPTGNPNPPTSGGWTIPTTGYYVSEGFRPPGRPDHTGIDLATGMGTPILAAQSGEVAMTYWDGCGGNMVSINHPNGWQTRYAHMNSWAIVSPGQYVSAGQTVGYVGSTGCSSGPHLHFEMRPNQDNGWYDFVNPAFYISF
ncbi:M23 family peptidase [Leucobacter zeae]|nr:M23 family peptidase [Leucobacter zeae]